MSLNKFCSSAVRKEWMQISCADVDCLSLECESINNKPVVGAVYVQTTTRNIQNSVSELSLNTSGFGNTLVPADYFTSGSSFKVRLSGTLINLVASTLTFRFYLGPIGTTQVFDFPISALPVATGVKGFKLEFSFTVVDVGGLGDASLFGVAEFVSQGDVAVSNRLIPFSASVNFDTTVANRFLVSAQFGAASVSNDLTLTSYSVLKEA